MATSADAEAALAKLLSDALASMPMVKTIRGWPASAALDTEIAGGNVIVSVSRLQMSRNTTRYLGAPITPTIPPPTLLASAIGGIATISGTANSGQIAGVIAKGIAYSVRTTMSDTPSTVAARIGQLMPGPVIVSGATISAAGLSDARSAADATSTREIGRQENTLQADIWCPTPVLRDQAEGLAVPAVGDATFLPMPDGTPARTRLVSDFASDEASALTIYRLMLRISVEVILSAQEQDAIALWPGFTLAGGQHVYQS